MRTITIKYIYHLSLCHPGIARTERIIRQHFTWDTMRQDGENSYRTCQTCQLTKRKSIKYGKIQAKEAEAQKALESRRAEPAYTSQQSTCARNASSGSQKMRSDFPYSCKNARQRKLNAPSVHPPQEKLFAVACP